MAVCNIALITFLALKNTPLACLTAFSYVRLNCLHHAAGYCNTNPSEGRGPAILVLTLIFVPFIILLVGARIYTRVRLTKNLGADDVVIVAAVVPTLACAVIALLAVLYYGWNRHIWDVPTNEVVITLKITMAVEILFSLGCTLTKVSILLLIIRVMASSSAFLQKFAIGMIILVSIEDLIFCIVSLNTCRLAFALQYKHWLYLTALQPCF
jgi:hypothetical protein